MSDDRYPTNFLYRYSNYQLIMTAISQFFFNRTAIDKQTDSSIKGDRRLHTIHLKL